MNENLLSTKFIICVLCLIIVSTGFFIGKISSEIFMPFILGIIGIFTAGNVTAKFADPKSAN